MFLNGLPFSLTRTRNVRFLTAEAMPSRSKAQLISSLKLVDSFYHTNGYSLATHFTDGELACLRHEVPGITLDTSAKNEHVGDAERAIQTVKDHIRAIRSGLTFRILPTRILIEIVAFAIMWLNAFPTAGGVSETYSPHNIIVGTQLNYTKHCRLPFGAYAQVHDDPDPTNITGVPCSTPGICLGPTGNSRGSYKFLNLDTGRVIKRYQFTKYAITPSVERRVA